MTSPLPGPSSALGAQPGKAGPARAGCGLRAGLRFIAPRPPRRHAAIFWDMQEATEGHAGGREPVVPASWSP